MNILKYKKIIVMVLIFVIFMTLVQLPLSASKKLRGAMIEVTMTDGSMVKGELLTVKADALLVYDQDAQLGKSLDLQQVARVKLLKKSKVWKGTKIGLDIGIGLLIYNGYKWLLYGKDVELKDLGLPLLTGLIGGFLGGCASIPEKFSLAGASSQIAQQNLERLKRYAREQDFTKPDAPMSKEIIFANSNSQSQVAQQKLHFRHRFRLLWLPQRQNISGNIDFRLENGTFRFVNNVSSKDTAVYPFQLNSDTYSHSAQQSFGQWRLEYEITPHFSSSLEFFASRKCSSHAYFGLSYYSTDYTRPYKSNFFMSNEYSYTSLLLGLNWKSFPSSFANKHIMELGVAAGLVQAQVNTDCNLYNQNSIPPQKLNSLTWSCKVHIAYDYFYTENFSLGGFISYQYLCASFSSATYFNEKQEFWTNDNYRTDYLTRPTEITIPGHNIQLGGMAYGIRFGVRF